MKRGFVLFCLAFLLIFIGFVSAIPKDFEVSNVYWATEGTMKNLDEVDKPFLLGLVELSFDTEKGRMSSIIVYLNYDGSQYRSSSLGLIKDTTQLNIGMVEAQFSPLVNDVPGEKVDRFSKHSLIIPIFQDGKIDFSNIQFSEFNEDLIIPDLFRTEESDAKDLFPNMKDLVTCSKSMSYGYSICYDIDKVDDASVQEFWECMEENSNITSVTFNCKLLCLKYSYQNPGFDSSPCVVYKDINFMKSTSNSLDFNELIKLNRNLEQFNPWRAGP